MKFIAHYEGDTKSASYREAMQKVNAERAAKNAELAASGKVARLIKMDATDGQLTATCEVVTLESLKRQPSDRFPPDPNTVPIEEQEIGEQPQPEPEPAAATEEETENVPETDSEVRG